MDFDAAVAIWTTWKDQLAQIPVLERSLAEQRKHKHVALSAPLLEAMSYFERVVSYAPHRPWLEALAQQVDIDLDAIAHSVLALRALMNQITADKLGLLRPSRPQQSDRYWSMVLGSLVVVAVLLAYLLGMQQAR
jgi:hypothetical protein